MIINLTEEIERENKDKEAIERLHQTARLLGTAARILSTIKRPVPYLNNKEIIEECLIQMDFNISHAADVLEEQIKCPF